ncbi:hypothetical protein Lalb_Chr18g0050781 [Lupinus albus]|uniref:Uncharacterized protein n=1 Tax=Lupinus albus TaxID=3870 RepID=A0A6A4NYE7_LUPAL|nr:hypothetical protein Lalb_Chr18g0050781 [Lupinus albus]
MHLLLYEQVPLNSLTAEPSSKVHREDKPQISMRQEAASAPSIKVEADMENYSQSETKELVEDELEKENLNKVNISDSQSMVTEGTNSKYSEETFGKSDIVNNDEEAIEQHLNKNETMVAFESVEESQNGSNTTHMKEVVVQLVNVNAPKPDSPNYSSEAGNFRDLAELVEDNKNNEKPESINAHEKLLQPSVIELTIPNKETNEGL